MKKQLKRIIKIIMNIIPASKNDILKLRNKIGESEKNMVLTYKTLEFKFWEYNNYSNKMLYELYLKNNKINKKFNPLVSIVVPVYNGSNYLAEALNSALAQTYDNIEIIVVNDGSTDDGKTKELAKKYKNKIRYYEKENGGVSSALNYGISKMKGQYFSWLSHDDLMEPDHIKNLVTFLSIEGNENKIPYSSFKIYDENGKIKLDETISVQIHCSDYKTSVIKPEYTLLQGEINGGSVLIPKEAFKKYGYFAEDQRVTQERDMWSRLMSEYQFINLPYDTAIIRSHSKQVTNVNPKIKIETDEKNLEIIKNLSEETIKRLEGNSDSFYKIMEKFYYNNSNKYMVEEIKKIHKNKN